MENSTSNQTQAELNKKLNEISVVISSLQNTIEICKDKPYVCFPPLYVLRHQVQKLEQEKLELEKQKELLEINEKINVINENMNATQLAIDFIKDNPNVYVQIPVYTLEKIIEEYSKEKDILEKRKQELEQNSEVVDEKNQDANNVNDTNKANEEKAEGSNTIAMPTMPFSYAKLIDKNSFRKSNNQTSNDTLKVNEEVVAASFKR